MKKWMIVSFIIVIMAGCGKGSDRDASAGTETGNLSGIVGIESAGENNIELYSETEHEAEITGAYDFTLCFAGDISLAENAVTTAKLDASDGDISKCISPELLEIMREALLDTFDTLSNAGIDYFGAGHDLEEAMSPVYYTINDKVVAFVGASRAEKNKMTPQATEDSPGILRCYDTELFLQVIEEADANADVIIGGHSHCLQGMEFYDDKPIIYSLGNYWFNNKTLDSMLIELHFSGNDEEEHLEVRMIPAVQTKAATNWVDETERQRIFDFMESISINVQIDENGILTERVADQTGETVPI